MRFNPPQSLYTKLKITHNSNRYIVNLMRQGNNNKMTKYRTEGCILTNAPIVEHELQIEIIDDVDYRFPGKADPDVGVTFLELAIQEPAAQG